jgi:hypothetical protein
VRVDLRRLHLDGLKTYLLPGDANSVRFARDRDRKEAPKDSMTKIVRFATVSFRPAIVSFEIAKEIYLWSGLDEDKKPYTRMENGRRMIDAERISRIGG